MAPNKIKESSNKSPDYEVCKNNQIVFYCVEKTLEYDDFEGEKNDSSRNAISTHIYKAIKQFNSVNPEHLYPNVLVFNNYDTLKNPNDLFQTLTGYGVMDSEALIKVFDGVGRIDLYLHVIDLYLWFDNGKFTNHIWAGINQNHENLLKNLFPTL